MAMEIMPGWPVVDCERQEVALESAYQAYALVDLLQSASENDGDVGQVELKIIVDAVMPQLRRALDAVVGALDDPAETATSIRHKLTGRCAPASRS